MESGRNEIKLGTDYLFQPHNGINSWESILKYFNFISYRHILQFKIFFSVYIWKANYINQ